MPSADNVAPPGASWETELFVLRGDDRRDLRRRAQSLLTFADHHNNVPLKDLAFSLNHDLREGGSRLAIVAGSVADFQRRLERAADRLSDPRCTQIKDVSGIYYFDRPLYAEGRIAVLFPGEGAQYLNMLKDLHAHFPEVQACFDEWERHSVQNERDRLTLAQLLFIPADADAETIQRAEQQLRPLGIAMLSVLAADWAIYQVLQGLGLAADAMAGHSMGELAALFAGGSLEMDPRQTDQIVSTLERLEQEEREEETAAVLLAVGAGRAVVTEVIQAHADDNVYLAMDNCPHQSVVVGPPEPMASIEAALQERRIMCERLPFNRPYHTPLFEPRLNSFDRMFDHATFRASRTRIYSCTTGRPFPPEPREIRRLAIAHWAAPVVFSQMIENMYADGIRLFVEAGPRGNLSAFVEDILRGRSFAALPADVPRRSGLTQLNHLAGQLAAHHVPLHLGFLYSRRNPQRLEWELRPPLPGPRNPVMVQYLAVMEQFLDVQREVTERYLTRRRVAGPQTTPARPLQHSAPPTPKTRPLIGAIVKHVPGQALTMRRRLDVAEDLFAAHHSVGGRMVSKIDPEHHGLPVMPMTFSLELMAEVAEILSPGKVVVGLQNIRLLRWLPFDEERPTTVEVHARVVHEQKQPERRVAVEIRDLGNGKQTGNSKNMAAQGFVILADRYREAPLAGDFHLTHDRPCRIPLEALYRNLFHGPLFQGVLSTDRVGDEGIESQVEVLPRSRLFRSQSEPAFLLDPVLIDVAMHPLASWHLEQPDQAGRILLPFELQRIDVFGPAPQVGARFTSRGRIESSSARHFTHGVDVVGADGRLWCRLVSAKYWRFYVPFGEVNFHGPKDEYFLSRVWKELTEDNASPNSSSLADKKNLALTRLEPPADLQQPVLRMATARVTLSPAELHQFRHLQESEAKINEWLFSRIVAKDAVRTLWYHRQGERLFPADIELDVGSYGEFLPRRRGGGGEGLPNVAVAHQNGTYAAAAVYAPSVGLELQPLTGKITIDAGEATGHNAGSRLVVWTGRDQEWVVAVTVGDQELR
jgi:malonyl CoA-acyl carrier protein transacylase